MLSFDSRAQKLEKNVYESVKGTMRLTLLQQDLMDYCPEFSSSVLAILDVGGGSGRFARICAQHGHKVLLCDSSQEMLQLAEAENGVSDVNQKIGLIFADFLSKERDWAKQFDMVTMHGSAEWMSHPERAVEKACGCLRPGGYLSLLVFNKDKVVLKRGINGLLLEGERAVPKHTLTPPGALAPAEILSLLSRLGGRVLLQSGIRVFHRFFRSGVDETVLTPQQWLEQEKMYYRKAPFMGLGEHTHFIWQAPL